MIGAPALMAASAGVAIGHAVLPDHWVPLAVVGRTQHYPLSRVARLSALAGVAHVIVSVILGAVIVAVGLEFRSTVEHAQNAIVGGLLVATGIGFAALDATGRGHSHAAHRHEHGPPEQSHGAREHSHPVGEAQPSRTTSLAAVMVPFGAAASPDLTILPVFLAAAAAGPAAAVGSLLVFAAVTIATIVTLTLTATASGYQVKARWLEQWGNLLTAVVLVVIGCLVLVGVL